MTREALANLPKEHKKQLDFFKEDLRRFKGNKNAAETEREKNIIKGYLKCLVTSEIITVIEYRALLLYYMD